jgi:hypothetical protein
VAAQQPRRVQLMRASRLSAPPRRSVGVPAPGAASHFSVSSSAGLTPVRAERAMSPRGVAVARHE